jgi:hypothetical protein
VKKGSANGSVIIGSLAKNAPEAHQHLKAFHQEIDRHSTGSFKFRM